MNLPLEISVRDVKLLLDAQANLVLLDCRTSEERQIVAIEPSTFLPMDEMMRRMAELETFRDRHIVVYCHHGQRSEMVCHWLRRNGFFNVQSMDGGIDAWSCEIDADLPRY